MATNDITLSASQKTTRFNPNEHLTDLKGKKYLEAKWRLVWFREDHPAGKVSTEMISADPLIFRASVLTSEGELLATGHGSAVAKQGSVWTGREVEKAETAAISRALGHAGYGTQFSEDDDKDYLSDSPVARKTPQPRPTQASQPPAGAPSSSASTPATAPVNGDSPELVVMTAGVWGITWEDRKDNTGSFYRLTGLDAHDSEIAIVAFDQTALKLLGFDIDAIPSKKKMVKGYNIVVPYVFSEKDGKRFANLDAAGVRKQHEAAAATEFEAV